MKRSLKVASAEFHAADFPSIKHDSNNTLMEGLTHRLYTRGAKAIVTASRSPNPIFGKRP